MATLFSWFLILLGLVLIAAAVVGLWRHVRPVPCPADVEPEAWAAFVARYNGRPAGGRA